MKENQDRKKKRGYDGYKRALVSIVYKFFDKKTGLGAIATSKAGVSVNEQLTEELRKAQNSMRDLKTIFGRQI